MLKYRREIDGLRALAVVSVIFYHARLEFNDTTVFQNGFVGVDIFFVISGYLITRITLEQIKDTTFSIKKFYINRIRRILPIFYLVFCVSTPFAWYTLLPDDFFRYQESLLTSALFISNIFFQNISLEYGAQDSLLNPLTHTWSLSIEEQFYIIFPLGVLLLIKTKQRYIALLLTILIASSLYWAQLISHTEPKSAFFQLGTRIWELLFGCLFGIIDNAFKNYQNKKLRIFLYISGLLILFFAFTLSYSYGHPGLITLFPVIATALIIAGSNEITKWHYPLTNNISSYIGKISFSLYLWHYPIFSLYRNFDQRVTNLEVYILISVVFITSIISFHFFEQPMRRTVNFRKFVWVMLGLSIPTISIALYTVIHPNFEQQWRLVGPKRLTSHYELIDDIFIKSAPKKNKMCVFPLNLTDQYYDEDDFQICRSKFGTPTIIIGDSHAENIFNAMSYSDEMNFIVSFAQGGCRPTGCEEGLSNQYIFFENLLSQMPDFTDGTLIYHQSGSHFISDHHGKFDSQTAFDELRYDISEEKIHIVKSYLEGLASEKFSQVIWLGPFIEYRHNPKDLVKQSYQGGLTTELFQVNTSSIIIFEDLERYLKNLNFNVPNLQYIAFDQLYLVDLNAIIETNSGEVCFQFRDRDHFSHCGEKVISDLANWSILQLHHAD